MLEVLARVESVSLFDTGISLGANEGHLNSSLQILRSLGWVIKDNNAAFIYPTKVLMYRFLKLLNVIDDFIREDLNIEVNFSLPVERVLARIG